MARFKFPIVGQAYVARSINQSAERCINCYAEMGQDGQLGALYGTPGTKTVEDCGADPIRGMIVAGDSLWVVSGNNLFVKKPGNLISAIGTLNTDNGFVSMATSPTEIIIVDGNSGYIVNIITSIFLPITDTDFPAGVTHVTYLDGYFIVSGNGTGQFFINENPNDGFNWNGTEFATAEGSPDNSVAIIANHRELWIFGTDSVEVWINTGNATFPFERSTNVFIEHGIGAPWSLEQLDNTLFWLGSDSRGNKIIYRANGYVPERISTHAIENSLNNYSDVGDAFAFSYQQEGHYFYVLTFPTGDETWVYDVSTGGWHQRAWLDINSGSLHYWRANCHAFFNGEHLVGDTQSGKVLKLDLNNYTDNDNPIKRIRTTSDINDRQLLQFFSMFQVQMETGIGNYACPDPQLMLRYSDDAGHTWSYERTTTVGQVGMYSGRAMWWRLGYGRNRVWEISMTDPVKFAVLGAVLEGQVGTS
jgi:hypothetical protein